MPPGSPIGRGAHRVPRPTTLGTSSAATDKWAAELDKVGLALIASCPT